MKNKNIQKSIETYEADSFLLFKLKLINPHETAVCVVTDSVGFTYTSSVSDMMTTDFTPEGKDGESDESTTAAEKPC